MTAEEVIKTIQVAIAEVEWEYPLDYSIAFETALNALEKQIPKKITHEATLQRCATCPTCKNVLDEFIELIPGQPKIRVTFAYCYFCGQALDWSDNNG